MNYIMECMDPPVQAFILHKIPDGQLTAVLLRYRAPPSLYIYMVEELVSKISSFCS